MNHIVSQGEDCAQFFRDYITADRKVLCIATLGFNDICLHFPLTLAGFAQVDFLFLVEDRPEVSVILRAAAVRNQDVLMKVLAQRKVTFEMIEIVASEDTANVAGRRAAQTCRKALQQSYTDVFVDASSMSRGVCFPVVKYVFEESKKPGPACMPMVKMNSTSPKLPSSLGMMTPKCPNSRAMKITADTSSDNPLILILPNMKPRATMRNRAK